MLNLSRLSIYELCRVRDALSMLIEVGVVDICVSDEHEKVENELKNREDLIDPQS